MSFNLVRTRHVYSYNKVTKQVINQDESFNDPVTDNTWHRTRTTPDKTGWRPPTSYQRSIRTGYTHTCELTTNLETSNIIVRGTGAESFGGSYSFNHNSFPSSLEDGAVNKALEKLKNGDFNIAQTFAERKRTARLIGDNARSIATVVEGTEEELERMARPWLRKGAVPGKILRAMFSRKLEVAYGWSPLLRDVFNGVKLLHEYESEQNRYRTKVTARAQENHFQKRVLTAQDGGINVQVDQYTRSKHRVFVRLDYRKINPVNATLGQLGIYNFPSLAYELLPFSFVADWFVPIGGYLSLLDADAGWSFLGGTVTRTSEHRINPTNGRIHSMHGSAVKGSVTCSGKGRIFSMNRKVLESSPMPRPPTFDDRGSTSHALNGIALLGAAFSSAKWWNFR